MPSGPNDLLPNAKDFMKKLADAEAEESAKASRLQSQRIARNGFWMSRSCLPRSSTERNRPRAKWDIHSTRVRERTCDAGMRSQRNYFWVCDHTRCHGLGNRARVQFPLCPSPLCGRRTDGELQREQ